VSYSHLFFDLDHTLWDHHRNANETLEDLYHEYDLNQICAATTNEFLETFHLVNHGLWEQYHLGEIDQQYIRDNRFVKVLQNLGAPLGSIPKGLPETYLQRCPQKPHLMPYTLEVLDYLKERYELSIITNGFADVQEIKMKASGLNSYFDHVITSESAGYLKPRPEIYQYTMNLFAVPAKQCLMIGDNAQTDIAGAEATGIDQVYYDPQKQQKALNPTYQIQCLSELKQIL